MAKPKSCKNEGPMHEKRESKKERASETKKPCKGKKKC